MTDIGRRRGLLPRSDSNVIVHELLQGVEIQKVEVC